MKCTLKNLFCLLILLTGSRPGNAQVFQPAVAYEDIFPTGSVSTFGTGGRGYSSCYNWPDVICETNGSNDPSDIYLSGYEGNSQGFAWRYTDRNNPAVIIDQGYVNYPPGTADIEVGLSAANGTYLIFVAYHKAGAGHFVDIYRTSGGVSLISSTQISTQASYTRISMDSHKLYGVAVAWQEPDGIHTMAWNTGTGSIVAGSNVVLDRTRRNVDPDVAFSHNNGDLQVHYAYYNPGNRTVTESYLKYPDLFIGATVLSPAINDLNVVPLVTYPSYIGNNYLDPRPTLDCPDHLSDNWAYTYTLNNSEISVRLSNPSGGVLPTTVVVNDGSLPPGGWSSSALSIKNFSPVLSYDPGGFNIYVGWWFGNIPAGANPTSSAFISVILAGDASGLVSPPDYMFISNAAASSNTTAINSLAFSKQNDPGIISANQRYLYSVYSTSLYTYSGGTWGPVTTDYYHQFHDWSITTAYKGTADAGHGIDCPAGHGIIQKTGSVWLSPNPFSDHIRLDAAYKLPTDIYSVQVSDIIGRLRGTVSGTYETVSAYLDKIAPTLAPGTYTVRTDLKSRNFSGTFKLQKLQ